MKSRLSFSRDKSSEKAAFIAKAVSYFGRQRTTTLLIVLSAVSYGTTFLRERYFYQLDLGKGVLDQGEVLMSALTIVSNIAGTFLVLTSSAGRIRRRQIRGCSLAAVGLVLSSALGGLEYISASIVVISLTAFPYWAQKAARNGRMTWALAGAITAPVPTLLIWSAMGTRHLGYVLLGYAAGSTWQALAAFAVSRSAPEPPYAERGLLLWPVLYLAAIQADAFIDQLLLIRAGAGWAGSAALASTLATAATLTVMYPLSSQLLADRFKLSGDRLLIGVSLGTGIIYCAGLPVFLQVALKGGHVAGTEFSRVLLLSVLYGLSVPFSIYWQTHTRAAHRDPLEWRFTAGMAGVLFLIHGFALVPIILFQAWTITPVATLAGFASAAAVWKLAAPVGTHRRGCAAVASVE